MLIYKLKRIIINIYYDYFISSWDKYLEIKKGNKIDDLFNKIEKMYEV